MKYKRWMDNQHLAMWRGLSTTQRQAPELISGPSPAAKTKFLSCNKTQFRVGGLLTGHNSLRRQLRLLRRQLRLLRRQLRLMRRQLRLLRRQLRLLRRQLRLMGLTSSPLCRRDVWSRGCNLGPHSLYDALASLRHVYLGTFFLDPEDIKS